MFVVVSYPLNSFFVVVCLSSSEIVTAEIFVLWPRSPNYMSFLLMQHGVSMYTYFAKKERADGQIHIKLFAFI